MSRKFAWRMAKLERFNKPERKYVIHVSDPATPEEEAAIALARRGVERFPILEPEAVIEEFEEFLHDDDVAHVATLEQRRDMEAEAKAED